MRTLSSDHGTQCLFERRHGRLQSSTSRDRLIHLQSSVTTCKILTCHAPVVTVGPGNRGTVVELLNLDLAGMTLR
jgi:hypothetical protein